MIKKNTEIQIFKVGGKRVYVKREDLATPFPGPPFSKCRGLYSRMAKLKEQGIQVVGYVETPISMAGGAVCWMAEKMQMKAVIFDPQYKHDTPAMLLKHREKWKMFNPEVIPIKAGMTCVNNHICRKLLNEKYDKAMLLPLGLTFPETVEETAKEYERTIKTLGKDFDTVVVSVGSGTIAAGLLKAMTHGELIGVTVQDKDLVRKAKQIWDKAGKQENGLFESPVTLRMINQGWDYVEPSKVECPFPCHPFYDAKAWEWLVDNILRMPQEILFWNIGREV